MHPFCVLVTSADDRKDIFDTCFAHSERIWKSCDWPRYVGLTTTNSISDWHYGFEAIASWGAKGWTNCVAAHAANLPRNIEYILLMVEDTLFMKPVDGGKLNRIASEMRNCGLSYVRLVPQRRSYIENAIARHGPFSIERIKTDAPYYSSTEMTIWERHYLMELLERPGDAWSFEHHISDREHWAVIDPVFDQHQIVQKGHWNWDAPRLLKRAGLPPPPPGRPYQTIWARLRGHRENLSFALLGFTGFRIRRWMRS